jgi:hypothetical protein
MGNNKMNVKTILLNENLDEGLYMKLEFFFFCDNTNSHMVCKLKKSIYGLK